MKFRIELNHKRELWIYFETPVPKKYKVVGTRTKHLNRVNIHRQKKVLILLQIRELLKTLSIFYRNECLRRTASVASQCTAKWGEDFISGKLIIDWPCLRDYTKRKNKSSREILNCIRMDTSRHSNISISRWLTTAQTPHIATGKASTSLYKYVKWSMNAEGMT